MKLKYYLRGLGIGIIGTAVILSIFFSTIRDTVGVNDNPNDAIVGEELNNDSVDNIEDTNDTEDKENIVNKETVEDKENIVDKENIEDISDKEVITENTIDESDDNDDIEIKDDASSNVTKVVKYELMIAPGDFSDTICYKLQKEGIIEDATDFNVFLNKNRYDSKLQPGLFVVEKGMSYEELAILLTTKTKK